jgi:phosphoribosyl 1,2-cyclic phosphate phosphodiesterase
VRITFLGTGTSQGVPVIGCHCAVCTSLDFRDKRLRASVHIQHGDASINIDAGPDFRQQMLRERIEVLDAMLITHEHKDHIAGLDDVRSFNFRQSADMPIYSLPRVNERLLIEYAYAFADIKYPGVPQFALNDIENEAFFVKDVRIQPIGIMHYKLPILGFRIGDFTYITDAKQVSPEQRDLIRGSKVVVVNALQIEDHISHFTLAEALDFLADVGGERNYLTHASHKLGKHKVVEAGLPPNVHVAYDGLAIDV